MTQPDPSLGQKRTTRATAPNSKDQHSHYNGDSHSFTAPVYSSTKALLEGQVWYGPEYARGLPGRRSIERFEAARKAVEVIAVLRLGNFNLSSSRSRAVLATHQRF